MKKKIMGICVVLLCVIVFSAIITYMTICMKEDILLVFCTTGFTIVSGAVVGLLLTWLHR